MCGLLGMHMTRKAKFFTTDLDEFKQMMHLTSFRGMHSSGIAGINLNDDLPAAIVKSTSNPHYLYSFAETTEFFTHALKSFTSLIGHCRFATHGEVNSRNAHPFQEGHIVLAHNGVISNFKSLRDEYKHPEITVDSHLVARLISEHSAEEILPKLEGSYALMWFDFNTKSFNIARNFSRPLFIGKMTHVGYVFASEKETIIWNSTRNKTTVESITELPPYKIYTFSKQEEEPTIIEYKPTFVSTSYVSSYKGYSGREHGNKWTSPIRSVYPRSGNARTIPLRIGDEIILDIVEFEHTHTTPQKTSLSLLNPDFPHVDFESHYGYLVKEEVLIERPILKGRVARILETDGGNTKVFDFKILVTPIELLSEYPKEKEEEDTKQFTGQKIQLITYNGTYSNLDKKSFKKYLRLPCPWCHERHDAGDFFTPEKLILSSIEEAIVCRECSQTMFDHWEREEQKVLGNI